MQVRGSQFSENPVLSLGFTLSDLNIGDVFSFSQGVTLEVGDGKFGNAGLRTGGPYVPSDGTYPSGGHYLVTGLDQVTYNSDDVYNISFFIKLNPAERDTSGIRRRIITTKDWTVAYYHFFNAGQRQSEMALFWREDDGTVGVGNKAILSRTGSNALYDGDYLFMQFRGGGGKNVSMRLRANDFNYQANVGGDFPDFIGDDGTIYLGGRDAGTIPAGFNPGGTADDFSSNLGANQVSDSSFRGNYDAFQIRNLGPSPANDGFISPPTTAPSSGVTFNNFDATGTTFDTSIFKFGSGVFERSNDLGFGGSGGILLNRNLEAETTTGGIAINLNQSTMSGITTGKYFYDLKLTDTNNETTRLIEGRFEVDK